LKQYKPVGIIDHNRLVSIIVLDLWVEPLAMWLTNLDLRVFFYLEISSNNPVGAIVVGVGVLLGVLIMIRCLRTGNTS
jgi:hypothetical protein